jgi:hypothetical protein
MMDGLLLGGSSGHQSGGSQGSSGPLSWTSENPGQSAGGTVMSAESLSQAVERLRNAIEAVERVRVDLAREVGTSTGTSVPRVKQLRWSAPAVTERHSPDAVVPEHPRNGSVAQFDQTAPLPEMGADAKTR